MILADTNVLLRSLHPEHPHHVFAEIALSALRLSGETLCLAPQNCVEFWAVATRSRNENGFGMLPSVAALELARLRRLFHLLAYTPAVLDTWKRSTLVYALCAAQQRPQWIMTKKIRWGVLGAAKIATIKVIPAMQKCEYAEITALASRDPAKSKEAAGKLGIPKSYGSYEALLADPEIDAVYNPLPNHLHVPMSIQAANAGKHVLCEKPVALSVAECRTLIDAQHRTQVKIGEAFMVRSHPQWLLTRKLIRDGEIGETRSIMVNFSYFNRDPHNVRNRADFGGGALMDIGCYAIQVSRFILDQEPLRVAGLIDRDPEFQTDRLTSALIEFPHTHLLFTCSTQMIPAQRVQVFGTTGRIEVEIPFNAPNDRPTRILVDQAGKGASTHELPICDQYTLQGDAFSRAIIDNEDPPTPLSDSIRNMAVIDAVFRSGKTGAFAVPENV